MSETIRLESMREFARVAEAKSFTRAAAALGVPKQNVSRHVAGLERALGVQLLHRNTRRLQLTEAGSAYALRCAEMVRLAEEANRVVTDRVTTPTGTLRVTADPVFGEAFLADVLVDYAARYPEIRLDVLLTRRHVNLVEEGFDIAFRIGRVDDPALSATRLGPAIVRYCASPEYVRRHGVPNSPDDLVCHHCIGVSSEGGPVRWVFHKRGAPEMRAVDARLRFDSFILARRAVLAGLGIAVFPEFACIQELRTGKLVSVLDDWVGDVGGVWLAHPTARFLSSRITTFADLAVERLGRSPPWVVGTTGVPTLRKRASRR